MAPHRCPVCEGRGTVPAGFYGRMNALTSTTEEKCRSCDGTGLVWELERVAPHDILPPPYGPPGMVAGL